MQNENTTTKVNKTRRNFHSFKLFIAMFTFLLCISWRSTETSTTTFITVCDGNIQLLTAVHRGLFVITEKNYFPGPPDPGPPDIKFDDSQRIGFQTVLFVYWAQVDKTWHFHPSPGPGNSAAWLKKEDTKIESQVKVNELTEAEALTQKAINRACIKNSHCDNEHGWLKQERNKIKKNILNGEISISEGTKQILHSRELVFGYQPNFVAESHMLKIGQKIKQSIENNEITLEDGLKQYKLKVLLFLADFNIETSTKQNDSDEKMEVFRDGNNAWTYQVFNVRGWKLLVEQSHLGDTKLIKDIRSTLEQRLAHIENVIPKQQVAFLKTIPIWVSDEPTYPLRPGENGVIPFHRSEGWLRNHGLNPHMAPGVHFINPNPIMYEHRVFERAPETMLHELAHAYHNLKLGLDQTDIRRAYDGAMARGLYQDVPSRSDPGKLVKAYAATNHEEYFSEITEAYFGQNDWFPRNRQELFEYDPKGYKVVEKVWGITSN